MLWLALGLIPACSLFNTLGDVTRGEEDGGLDGALPDPGAAGMPSDDGARPGDDAGASQTQPSSGDRDAGIATKTSTTASGGTHSGPGHDAGTGEVVNAPPDADTNTQEARDAEPDSDTSTDEAPAVEPDTDPDVDIDDQLDGGSEAGQSMSCPTGHAWVVDRCIDIDECAGPAACPAHRVCDNTTGGFTCGACLPGFADVSGACRDVDECELDPCDAEAFCANTTGAHTCRCPAYYTDDEAGAQCVDERFRWLYTAPLFGVQMIPFETDLLVAGTHDREIVLGNTRVIPVGAGLDISVARLDATGNPRWLKRFGTPNNDRVMWGEVDSQGDLLLTGFTDGGLDFGTGAIDAGGVRARFVVKLRAGDGAAVWTHALLNVDAVDEDWEGFVSADASDNALICGRFREQTSIGGVTLQAVAGWDTYVAKIAPDGALLWARAFGGPGAEQCRSVVADAQGNVLVNGVFDNEVTFGTDVHRSRGSMDVFLAKLDPEGTPLWSRSMGGLSYDLVSRMTIDAKGSPIMAGYFNGQASFGGPMFEAQDYDAFIAKWSDRGEPLWSKRLGGPGNDVIWGIDIAPNDDLAVAGYMTSEIDFGEGLRRSAGSADAFVARYAPDGTLRWSFDFGGSSWDNAAGIRFDALGAIYAAGWFESFLDVPQPGTLSWAMYILHVAP
jgi:hypothetical protein